MVEEIVTKILGHSGKLISYSKGFYTFNNPNNIVVFNSKVFSPEFGIIWSGDLDLSKDKNKIDILSKELDVPILVFSESIAYQTENISRFDYGKAVYISYCGKMGTFNISSIVQKKDGNWYHNIKKIINRTPKYCIDNKYKLEDFQHSIQINIKKFKGKGELNPLEHFYDYLLEEIKILNLDPNKIDVYITEYQYSIIEKNMVKWAKKLKKSDYETHKIKAWLPLYAPFTFYGSKYGAKWTNKKLVYIKKRNKSY